MVYGVFVILGVFWPRKTKPIFRPSDGKPKLEFRNKTNESQNTEHEEHLKKQSQSADLRPEILNTKPEIRNDGI